MSEIPSKFAVVQAAWGAEKKHIYTMNDWDLGYYKTEEEARDAARRLIVEEDAKMVAILEVKALLVRATCISEVS